MNSRIMRFQDFRFKDGEQVTIRRGTKWDIGRTDGVLIGRAEGDTVGAIDIIETAALHSVYDLPVLHDLPNSPIIDHHADWTLVMLCAFFRDQYPLWRPRVEIVTLVRFKIVKIFKGC